MPLGTILSLAVAFLQVIKVLAEKFLPEKHVPTFRKIGMAGTRLAIDKFSTYEEIIRAGKKKDPK